MSQLGRLLVLTAQYYAYTGDASLLLRHEAKLAGIAQLLHGRRQSALAAFPAGNRRDCRPELAAQQRVLSAPYCSLHNHSERAAFSVSISGMFVRIGDARHGMPTGDHSLV